MKKTTIWAAVATSSMLAIAACVADPDPITSSGGDDAGGDSSVPSDGSPGDANAVGDGQGGDAACTPCGASCVDLQTSAENCGTCGKACKTGVSCGGGHCANEVLAAAPGSDSSCVLLADGDVWCWGDDQAGELGAASATEKCDQEPLVTAIDSGQAPCRTTPAKIAGLPVAKQICGGRQYFCALAADDTAWCWGRDDAHQLGHTAADSDAGTTVAPASRTPTQVAAISALGQITCGNDFACALTKSGSVYCWGSNGYGNLGSQPDSGTGSSSATPVLMGGLPAVTEISASDHACAVTSDHHVWCWGNDASDGVGHDSNVYCGFGLPCQPTPAVIATDNQAHAFDGIDHVRTGSSNTCAHKTDGTVWCWGNNLTGVLGNGTNEPYGPGGNHPDPTAVSSVGNSAVSFDLRSGDVFVHTSTGVVAWGSDLYGELGAGTFSVTGQSACQPAIVYGNCLDTPASSTTLGSARVFAGFGSGLGINADNTVWAWGQNSTGQLGHPQFGDAGDVACAHDVYFPEAYCNPTPIQVKGLP